MNERQPTSTTESNKRGVRGAVLSFTDDPFLNAPDRCYRYIPDGLVVISSGHITDVGEYASTISKYPDLTDVDTYSDALIIPGFIDCHTHYVQAPMIGSCGDTLLDWLRQYTFPTESKFNDRQFADDTARMFFRELLNHGTTTANVFATTYPTSVDAVFEESERYGTRMISGKVLQDRNIPDTLRDVSAEESIIESERLLKKWHRRGRQLYAVTPRFAPTSTPTQLRLAGELYQRYIGSGVYMHTHLDETESEIEWVKELFPGLESYTDVYRSFGLVDRLSVFAHCCIVRDDEWETLHRSDCGIAHCPSSNLFLGDGMFRYREAKDPHRPVHVGIGTDVGGGTNFSIPRQLGDAYKVAMLHKQSLDALRSLYLATRGGAETLHLEHIIGSIAPGYEADMTVIDLKPSEFAAWRLNFADSIFDKLFVLFTLGPDNLTRATYVAGRKVYDRDRTPRHMYARALATPPRQA